MQPRANTTLHPLHRTWLARATAALVAASAFAFVPHAQAATFISVNIAPPPLPVYEQPYMPGPGYLWAPGYWAWDGNINDYYWVPGTWVRAPYVGALWTPGYWGWRDNAYFFHTGYWGPHIGYYGGINYGYGYFGLGYVGGYWQHGGFYYNSAYNRYGSGIHINFYNRPATGITVNRFSFNGPGGVVREPTREELVADHERHVGAVGAQVRQMDAARHDQTLRASVNHGTPGLAATSHAGAFSNGHEVARHEEATAPHGHRAASMAQPGGHHHDHAYVHAAHSGQPVSHRMATEGREDHPSHGPNPHEAARAAPPRMEPQHMAPQHIAAPPPRPSHPANERKPQKDDHKH